MSAKIKHMKNNKILKNNLRRILQASYVDSTLIECHQILKHMLNKRAFAVNCLRFSKWIFTRPETQTNDIAERRRNSLKIQKMILIIDGPKKTLDDPRSHIHTCARQMSPHWHSGSSERDFLICTCRCNHSHSCFTAPESWSERKNCSRKFLRSNKFYLVRFFHSSTRWSSCSPHSISSESFYNRFRLAVLV